MITRPFELVLHHRYEKGLRDLSGHGNDGYGTLGRGPGRIDGVEAGAFDGTRARVFVPPSSTLSAPGSIRAELTVNLDELGRRRTLVEGYLSFALYVESNGSIGAAILRYGDWYSLRSDPGLVQAGRWVVVELLYLADTQLSVSLDGVTVAEAVRSLGDANGVAWPFGLNIGAWPDADERMLRGRIEEVRLWRTPPRPSS